VPPKKENKERKAGNVDMYSVVEHLSCILKVLGLMGGRAREGGEE
jgi:hypothetical protein